MQPVGNTSSSLKTKLMACPFRCQVSRVSGVESRDCLQVELSGSDFRV